MRSTCTLLLLLSVLTIISFSTTRKVPQEYGKIQLAINAANDGDTVLVDNGKYLENIVITKKIVLASKYIVDNDITHITNTILDGSGYTNGDSASVVTIDGATDTTTVVAGFTITKGLGNKRTWTVGGITYTYRTGLGVDIAGGGARIRKNIIKENTMTTTVRLAAAVNIWDTKDDLGVTYAIVEENEIVDNVLTSSISTEGGAFSIGHNCRISRNVIARNSALGSTGNGFGGVAQMWQGTAKFDANIIYQNKANYGGVIQVNAPGPTIYLTNNIIAKNNATQGGALWLSDAASTIYSTNNTFAGNSAVQGSGNAFYLKTGATIKLLNTIVWNQGVSEIYSFNSTVDAAYSDIRGGWEGPGNIASDPLFVANDTLYHLSSSSPAIGSGIVSATVGGILLNAPAKDFSGSIRSNPSWSNPDIGAMESAQAFPGVAHAYNVPKDYAKIQDAINASVNGDVVLVSEGTYKENLVLTKKITLASLFYLDNEPSHIAKTILDGSAPTNADSGAVISIGGVADTTTVVDGFTITKGTGNKHVNPYWDPTGTHLMGGGIEVNTAGATIRNNIITGNVLTGIPPITAVFGGGIEINDLKTPGGNRFSVIENNTISKNYLYGGNDNAGGAFDIVGSVRIVNNKIISNNSMYSVSGVAQNNPTRNDTAVIQGNLYQGNTVTINLSGLVIAGSRLTGIIRNNTFIDNVSGTFYCIGIADTAYAIIDGNYIARNIGGTGGTIYFWKSNRQSIIRNNIIAKNSGYGIGLANGSGLKSSAQIINNTIVGNGSGIAAYTNSSSQAFVMNNIVKNTGVEFTGNVYASYNLVEGGYTGTENINADPLFVANDSLYHLTLTSPCISAGIYKSTVGGVLLTAKLTDYFGDARPRPFGMRSDLGAVEHDSGSVKDPTGVKEIFTDKIPTTFAMSQNFPNPFNPTTTIRYALPTDANVKLVVYDLLGREIATLANEEQPAGWKEVQWNATNVASGIYIYKLTADSFVETKKMLLLR